MTRSIVTGAAGFVGSHLVDRLLALGHEVVGIDCFTAYYARATKEANLTAARANERFQLIEGDLCAIDLPRLLQGIDYVFHEAGQAGVRASWGASFADYVRNNISATQHVLEAAKDAALKKLVFASSSSVYGDALVLPVTEDTLPRPVSPYGVTKLAAEHLCSLYARVHGVPVISLRLFTVYGPRQRPDMAIQGFLSAALASEPVELFGDGAQTRDFTYVQDVVDAHLAAMTATTDEAVLNICGGSRVSLNELLELIERVTARPLRVERGPAAPGDARHTLGDNARARRALGFQPRVSLEEGIAAHWAWLQTTTATDP